MVPPLKFENYFLPSQFENMTNSEKPPFESKNKVGYVRFRFETWLPNYLVGLTNLSYEKPNFGNKLLSKNENVPRGRVLLLSARRRARGLCVRPAPSAPPALVLICTLPRILPNPPSSAPSVCLSSSIHNQILYSVAYSSKNTTKILEDNKEPFTFKQSFNRTF